MYGFVLFWGIVECFLMFPWRNKDLELPSSPFSQNHPVLRKHFNREANEQIISSGFRFLGMVVILRHLWEGEFWVETLRKEVQELGKSMYWGTQVEGLIRWENSKEHGLGRWAEAVVTAESRVSEGTKLCRVHSGLLFFSERGRKLRSSFEPRGDVIVLQFYWDLHNCTKNWFKRRVGMESGRAVRSV